MRIKDEYAYRELVTSSKILLLEAGTQGVIIATASGQRLLCPHSERQIGGRTGLRLNAGGIAGRQA